MQMSSKILWVYENPIVKDDLTFTQNYLLLKNYPQAIPNTLYGKTSFG